MVFLWIILMQRFRGQRFTEDMSEERTRQQEDYAYDNYLGGYALVLNWWGNDDIRLELEESEI